jgi:hypothetical protein
MSAPTGYPAPAMNMTAAGFSDAADDVAAADVLVTVGDFTGGAAENMFTLAAHGLNTGDYVFLLHKIAAGAATGAVGTKFKVKVLSASTFQLTDLAGNIITNSADGASVVFLKGSQRTPDAVVQNVIVPRLIVADGDFTGGAVELDFVPRAYTGMANLEDTNTLKLLYKAAAGVVKGIAVNTIVYAKSSTAAVFCVAATSGGNAIANDADGLAIFIKTS